MKSLTQLVSPTSLITVCDIGAALGEAPSYQPLVDAGHARIVGFEPNVEQCKLLNEKYDSPHRFFPFFIGDGNPHTFYETNWVQTGSLFEPDNDLNRYFNGLADVSQVVARHPVETTRLDDIPDLDDIDFLKIDVQGAELMVFQNAPNLLKTISVIQTEVEFLPSYKYQPLFSDVDPELRAHHFLFHTFEGFGCLPFKPLSRSANPHDGFRQAIWSDAVYVKDWRRLSLLSDDKLKKYAIILHDVFKSFDLCHLILEELSQRDGGNWGQRYRTFLGTTHVEGK